MPDPARDYMTVCQQAAADAVALSKQAAFRGINLAFRIAIRPSGRQQVGAIRLIATDDPLPAGFVYHGEDVLTAAIPWNHYSTWLQERARRAPFLS